MKVYRGKILNSAAFLILRLGLIGIIAFALIEFWFGFRRIEFLDLGYLIAIIFILALLILLYALLVNNDIVLTKNQIIIRKRLILCVREKSIDFKEVEKIELKHDWVETIVPELKPAILKHILVDWILTIVFPPDYKWIKIKTHTKAFKYHCFGIEHDYFENPEPHFDDLYFDLAQRGIHVEWTNDTDPYYRDLRKRKEEILQRNKAR